MRSPALKADGLLLLVAAIWGSGFVAQRAATEWMGPFTFNGARYALGCAILLPILAARRRLRPTRAELLGGLVLGVLMAAAAWSQQKGLETTTAARAAFLTGLYVLLVPPIGLALFKRPIVAAHLAGAALAAAGLWLLSGDLAGGFSLGDQLVLLCAGLWALHVVLTGELARSADALRLAAVQFAVVAATSGALALALERETLASAAAGWLPVVYSGVFVIAIAFTLQIVAQREAPASHAAVLMSLEAAFGALFGVLLLGERLSAGEWTGCGLMLGGCIVSQLWPHKRSPAEAAGVTDPVR